VSKIISKIPKDKLLILDIDVKEFSSDYAILYQNFEKNMYQGLHTCVEKIKKYESINLVLSQKVFNIPQKGSSKDLLNSVRKNQSLMISFQI